jgi:outer membrane receptor protein involved in Fe transport
MRTKPTFFKYSTLALAVTYSLGSLAQETAPTLTDEAAVEKIQVTGSRISRDPNLASPSPVQSISAAEIQSSGEFSITDVINDIPALFSSTTAESSIDSAFAEGANVLNLRGLGSARTLTIVNGRRHVGGVGGSAAVDVGSIPMALIESVDVLTGGASAVYGADAVTGVVNFQLRDDFEGFELDIQTGRSGENDADQYSISGVWGTNFDNDRGNFAVAVEYQEDKGLRVSERDDGLIRGSASDWANPALRFQQGDLGSGTPNLSQYFDYANTGLFAFGLEIPSMAEFIANYTDEFGSAPSLTDAEMALFNQAASAAPRAVLPYRTFPFTSGYGYIIPGNPYTFDGFDPETAIDLDGNGTPDCLDSFSGYNSSFGAASFGVLGGCWNVNQDGSYRPIIDGLVAGNFEGFGGDSYNTLQQQEGFIITPNDKIALNFLFSYDVSDNVRAFAEAKYVVQTAENESQPTAFWDLLFGAPDNPYLPAFIQPIADATGGVAITADPIGIGSGKVEQERETIRIVAGFEGVVAEDYDFELYLNYGKFTREARGTEEHVIVDRFFSAIDAVNNNGTVDCRVNVDPSAPQITTPFDIPVYDPGYFTFTPGDGSCVPLNIWAGRPGIDQAAVDWITEDSFTKIEIDQLVIAANLAGDSSKLFEMPYGPVYWSLGTEYRKESSDTTLDAFQQGIIPAGAPFPEGTNIADYSANNSVVFRPALRSRNQGGDYDVYDVYAEASIPLIMDEDFAEELTLDVAARYSDYSTVGQTFTWRTNLMYSPFSDLRIRYSLSKAVRAPNISELFAPETGTTFRPTDTCNANVIDGIAGNDAAAAAQIQANCVAQFSTFGLEPFDGDGNYVYTDPLSAAFGGVSGGNPNLTEEEADTTTIGFVYDSSLLEGLTVTADYWSIEIDQAISSVSADDIVNGCYTGAQLNDNFCSLFTRNTDSNSPQYGGLNFLRTTDINFAKLTTSGVDFTVAYEVDLFDGNLRSALSGSKVNELDQFTNPTDLTEVNPELGEIQRPEYAGNLVFNWSNDVFSIGLQNQYIGEQLLGFVEIEEFERGDYDSSVQMDAVWLHDINASYKVDEVFTVYGGINNLTDEQPFLTNFAYPVGPRGRFFFFGVDMKFQ